MKQYQTAGGNEGAAQGGIMSTPAPVPAYYKNGNGGPSWKVLAGAAVTLCMTLICALATVIFAWLSHISGKVDTLSDEMHEMQGWIAGATGHKADPKQ